MTLHLGKLEHEPIDAEPALSAHREERYSVAVIEVHYRSFQADPAPASLPAPPAGEEPRQLKGRVEEQHAA